MYVADVNAFWADFSEYFMCRCIRFSVSDNIQHFKTISQLSWSSQDLSGGLVIFLNTHLKQAFSTARDVESIEYSIGLLQLIQVIQRTVVEDLLSMVERNIASQCV